MANHKTKEKGVFNRFLDIIETVGNKLPHPVTLFVIFATAVVIISAIAGAVGLSVDFEKFVDGELVVEEVKAVSLLTPEGIRRIFTEAITNFTSFAPLGTVLVAMLGVGVAEGSGLVGASLKKLVLSTPKRLITVVVVFAGIMSSIASAAGYVVLVPLGALIFVSFGRHPIAGLAAAFAGVSGGFSANLVFGSTDALLSGLTEPAAQMIDPNYAVGITANWYFMIASTFLITILGAIVTEKLVEPRLGDYKGKTEDLMEKVTPEESRGLKWAGISLIAFFAGKSMATMGGYLVLAFVASQFVNYFTWSNLGTILAVTGASFLETIGFTGLPLGPGVPISL